MTEAITPRPDLPHMSAPSPPIALELLDASRVHALQRWQFFEVTPETAIRIGRAPDNDVVLTSPFVSRAHAVLRPREGDWELSVVSDKGVFVDGRRVQSHLLGEGTVFQVAPQGPCLRVVPFDANYDDEQLGTLSVDSTEITFLALDVGRRDAEVEEIAGGDYFKNLQHLARQLKAGKVAT
ncbi:MAG: FHA domain-containing protein [Pirellulales bacterium]|nr:FHA domain-containing protein [Pirellulales bacterium]